MADIKLLFETNALKICEPSSPFWYTSGLIGVFYINTHFLCGGDEIAIDVLKFIDDNQNEEKTFPEKILSKLESVYEASSIYKKIIDESADKVNKQIVDNGITHISGGQRRDWFFAPLIAKMLKISCLYIYNDKRIYDSSGDKVSDLSGAKVLNIADLLTVGSSYTDKWVPAVKDIGGELISSFNIVDRNQGGSDNLKASGITSLGTLYSVDSSLFQEALSSQYVSQEQYDFVNSYLTDSEGSMKVFLTKNPQFLKSALDSSDAKTQQRARKLVDGKLYGELS